MYYHAKKQLYQKGRIQLTNKSSFSTICGEFSNSERVPEATTSLMYDTEYRGLPEDLHFEASGLWSWKACTSFLEQLNSSHSSSRRCRWAILLGRSVSEIGNYHFHQGVLPLHLPKPVQDHYCKNVGLVCSKKGRLHFFIYNIKMKWNYNFPEQWLGPVWSLKHYSRHAWGLTAGPNSSRPTMPIRYLLCHYSLAMMSSLWSMKPTAPIIEWWSNDWGVVTLNIWKGNSIPGVKAF